MPGTDRGTPRIRKRRRWMPKMHGAAVQCCMCIVGVFLFLGGLIMLVTGVCLILNYGIFDENLLPPDLQNEDGKKTVGIILTCCGLFAILISVVASLMYLCTKSKHSTINPRELSRIPTSARNTPPDRHDNRRRSGPVKPLTTGNVRGQPNTKSIPGSTEVIQPRQPGHRKGRNRKMKHRVRRLEEIKEQDAISRRTVEGGALADDNDFDQNMTPRSGSFSSQFTLDETRNPRIVVASEESVRCPSTDSASTSQMSDISNFRGGLENDKSRRELQFLPDSIRYNNTQYDSVSKDSMSLSRDGESMANRRDSEEGSIVSERYTDKHHMSTSSFNSLNDKVSAGGNDFTAQGRLPDVSSSDEGSISYKASSLTEFHGDKTSVGMSPQMGEVDTHTKNEIQTFSDANGGQKQSVSQSTPDPGEQTESTPEVALVTSYTQDNGSQRQDDDNASVV